jgi:glycine C-acetyltransferase
MDLFEKIKHNRGPLGQNADQFHGYFTFPKLEGPLGPRMLFRGQEKIVWSLNNYIGLANHQAIRKADTAGTEKWGLAYPMGARMMSGDTTKHEALEDQLAAYVQKPAGVLVNFGYQAMASAIQCLVDRKDVIVYDSECHACIMDGMMMTFSKRFVYQHNDIDSCKKQLERATKIVEATGGAILLITEGVFGMDGDQGKLKEIVALKQSFNFRMLVDDAHGFGVLGATGAGTGEAQNIQADIDIYFSTFAKSMASIGAFFATTKDVAEYLKYNLRSQVFAKSLPMAIVEGNLKRLEMLQTMPELRTKLWVNVERLQSGLKERGFNIGKTNSCVTPVYLDSDIGPAGNLIVDLRENYHVFCSAVMYPVVPKGILLLRLIPSAVHTFEDIDETLAAFDAVHQKLKKGAYDNLDVPSVV